MNEVFVNWKRSKESRLNWKKSYRWSDKNKFKDRG
jgi:hypothetical protein